MTQGNSRINLTAARSGQARPHPRPREWHDSGSGWISGAIYGANDGLAAVFGIVTGVSGATGGSSFVLTAGVAGAVASALSMATGAFLAERSELEVAAANVERERQEIAEHPEEEKEELSLFYQLKGLDAATADSLAEEQAQDPDAMLRLLPVEELGGAKAAASPVQASLAAGMSTGIGAIIPGIPFFFLTGGLAIVLAGVVSLVAHFAVGAAKSLFTLRSWWASGLEMTARRRDRRRRDLRDRPRLCLGNMREHKHVAQTSCISEGRADAALALHR